MPDTRLERRRAPRIEGLDLPMACIVGDQAPLSDAVLRDLSMGGMRLDHVSPAHFARLDTGDVEAHVPGIRLHLHCRSRVARVYRPQQAGRRGLAFEFLDLDPAVRGMIRSLTPSGAGWPDSTL